MFTAEHVQFVTTCFRHNMQNYECHWEGYERMDEARQAQLTNLFKALAHPGRMAILDILRNGEQCVCHIEAQLGYRQAYISQQLAVLRQAGLIEDQRDGWNIYYRIVRPEVFALVDVARTMVGLPVPGSSFENPRCPCPKCAPPKKRGSIYIDPTESE